MQISPYKFNNSKNISGNFSNNPSFLGRKDEIKEADKLQRKAKAVFPMLNATYMEEFYHCAKPESKNHKRAAKILKRLGENISLQRSLASLQTRSFRGGFGLFGFFNQNMPDDDISEMHSLEWIKDCKIGCCDECAETAFAVLCANGYYNSSKAYVYYGVQFVNKESGEIEYETGGKLPHCFVVTDLCKGEEDEAKDCEIVVDPWLGFADYKPNALLKFKQALSGDIEEMTEEFKKRFAKEKQEAGETYNPDDYEIKTLFKFKNWYPKGPYYNREFGNQVREKYPETILDVEA